MSFIDLQKEKQGAQKEQISGKITQAKGKGEEVLGKVKETVVDAAINAKEEIEKIKDSI